MQGSNKHLINGLLTSLEDEGLFVPWFKSSQEGCLGISS